LRAFALIEKFKRFKEDFAGVFEDLELEGVSREEIV
jgi:hypothetical protein